jgi:hypothetical protein
MRFVRPVALILAMAVEQESEHPGDFVVVPCAAVDQSAAKDVAVDVYSTHLLLIHLLPLALLLLREVLDLLDALGVLLLRRLLLLISQSERGLAAGMHSLAARSSGSVVADPSTAGSRAPGLPSLLSVAELSFP